MNIGDGSQAGYALVIAALVTGICAWVAQKTKTRSENDRNELNFEAKDRQNLIEGYRESNKQLQERVNSLYGQIDQLWNTINIMRKSLEECERSRIADIKSLGEVQNMLESAQRSHIEDTNRIIELERQVRIRRLEY